jgi:hypothetical protein
MQTNFISATKIKTCFNLNTSYGLKKTITAVGTIKFLDLKINYHLKLYKEHTDYITSTLNTVFFAIKAVTPLFTTYILNLNLFAYLHSMISDGVTIWKN